MSANEIYLKVKTLFTDTALPKIKAFTANVARSMSRAGQAVAGISAVMGELPGKMGKAISGLGRVWTAFMALGPVGAVVAGIGAAWELVEAKMKKSCDAMVEASKRALAAVEANFAKMKQGILDNLDKSLKSATTEAQRTARAFETLAASYLKVADAKGQTAAAGDSAEVAALKAERTGAMAAASEGARAGIGAEYDVKIAERIAKATAENHERAVAKADAEAAQAAGRLNLATDAEAKAKKALAEAETMESRAQHVRDEQFRKQLTAKREAAEQALFDAQQKRIAAETEVAVANEKQKQAALAQAAALNDASAAVVQAKQTYADLVRAQKEAAAAEVAQKEAAAKRAALEGKQGDIRANLGGLRGAFNQQQAAVAAAEQGKANAWALYKSPEAMKAKLQEEKEEAKAQARFSRDAARLQRRSDWRTARLSARDEATRRMLLAQEEAKKEKAELDRMRKHVEEAENQLKGIAQTLNKGVVL